MNRRVAREEIASVMPVAVTPARAMNFTMLKMAHIKTSYVDLIFW
jgi:hypothetical protein